MTKNIDQKTLKNHELIKERISKVGIAIPGTMGEKFLKCGREYCDCMKKESARHGPYYFWTRKVGGKVTSKSIQKELVPYYKKLIANRNELEALTLSLLDLGQEYAANLTEREPESAGKSKKGIKKI